MYCFLLQETKQQQTENREKEGCFVHGRTSGPRGFKGVNPPVVSTLNHTVKCSRVNLPSC